MFPIASTSGSGLKLKKTTAVVDNFSQIKHLLNAEDENQKKMLQEIKIKNKIFKNDQNQLLMYKQRMRREEATLKATRSKITELHALLEKIKKT
ncbi:unnamed protein product [Macrosiphum euphorbiae]|uniref:Uncharacterized protein n=1 Tax=Macrosiphum euphorbiae TaxID=13131 RepID=A0AAV0WFQ4_9HEMI|nr:unnamed protein product [Macrosiphum euphorbiae]